MSQSPGASPANPLQLDAESARLLADLGFIAIMRGMNPSARALFSGLLAARPEAEAGQIGMALVHLAEGEVAAALRRLEAAPPSDAVLTFQALALARQGDRAAAREALAQACSGGRPLPLALALRESLGLVEPPAEGNRSSFC